MTQQQLSTCGVEAIVCAHLWRQPAPAPAHVPMPSSEVRFGGRTLPLWPPWPNVQFTDGRRAPSNLYGRRELYESMVAGGAGELDLDFKAGGASSYSTRTGLCAWCHGCRTQPRLSNELLQRSVHWVQA